MFKKIISIVMVMVLITVTGCAISASAVCASEEDRPGIVGMEHMETIAKLYESWYDDEIEVEYEVAMVCTEAYWSVVLESLDGEVDYVAVGYYDHYPTEEELDILWANRLTEDEMNDLMAEFDF